MKSIVFSTWCTDDYVDKVNLEGLKNSLKYFHPDIPHVIYDTKETERLKSIHSKSKVEPYYMMPFTCMELAEDFDMVIHIDADSTVTGPLTELLEAKEDIVGVRNNNSFGKAGCHDLITLPGIPPYEFLNAGLVGSNNKHFWHVWNYMNQTIGDMCDGHENDTLCMLFQENQFTTKMLDPLGTEVSYGLSNVWGTEHHWESWKDLYIVDDKLMLDDPNTGKTMHVKVMHQGGGSGCIYPMRPWMDSLFTDEVKEYFRKITS